MGAVEIKNGPRVRVLRPQLGRRGRESARQGRTKRAPRPDTRAKAQQEYACQCRNSARQACAKAEHAFATARR
eukprot:5754439-Alexandrium_andersonii.AAC.1